MCSNGDLAGVRRLIETSDRASGVDDVNAPDDKGSNPLLSAACSGNVQLVAYLVDAAGADIKEMAGKSFVDVYTDDLFGAEIDRITATRKPIIAAVSGYALGGGCELAMACDFILCADNAKFGQPEINLGVIAGIGGTQRLTRFVGKSKAMEMHLTGRFMDAAEAERSGLVSRVVPAAKLIPEALAAARKIAEKGQIAVMAAKEAVNRAYETTLREGILFERRSFQALFATEDQKEGMAAFLEKREPQFRDR
mgnify:CR=1 FL=1